MSDLVFPGFDPATGMLSLPLWAAGAAAALLTAFCLVVFRSSAGVFWRALAVVIVAVGTWIFLERSTAHDRTLQRNALDARALQLTAQVMLPGSALACLDAAVGDALEAACEKAVFATPETVTAAMSYTAARFALLADGVDFALRRDASYESALAPLRKTLESDRFGILAQLLAQRDNCTSAQCDAFAFLRDPSRVQANLKDRAFDGYLAHYAANWARTPARPLADAGNVLAPTPSAPLSSKYSFPSAASIPPVSIMNAEPVAPPGAASAAPAAVPAPAQAASSASPPAAGAPTPPKRPPIVRPAQRAASQAQPPRNPPLPLQAQPAPDSAEQPNTQ